MENSVVPEATTGALMVGLEGTGSAPLRLERAVGVLRNRCHRGGEAGRSLWTDARISLDRTSVPGYPVIARHGGERADTMNLLQRTFRIGRVFDIDVRVHMLFLLWAVLSLLGARGAWLWQVVFLVLLFGLVFLHELGHALGARFMGGHAEHIVLWPLGGLATVSPPASPVAMAVTTVAGPAVNLCMACFTGLLLWFFGGGWDAILVNPFGGLAVQSGNPVIEYIHIFYQVNLLLVAFNLLPIYPLDGGHLLEALLWARMGEYRARDLVCRVGLVGAVAMVVSSFAPSGGDMLLFIGLVGGYTCYRQLQLLRSWGVGGPGGARSGGTGRSGGMKRWWNTWTGFGKGAARTRGRERPSRSRRRPGDSRWVDNVPDLDDDAKALLKKVEEQGIHTLTEEERARLMEAFRRRRERDEYLH